MFSRLTTSSKPGGENIYPLEIEERLLQHPFLNAASIVGLRDERYGESVNAFLAVRPGHQKLSLEDIQAFTRETLGRQKAPVRVFWVGSSEAIKEFPVTGSGKIRKEILREMGNKMIAPTARMAKL